MSTPAVLATIGSDLEAFLGERVLAVSPIPEGHSGFTYWVQLEGRRAVLRLPPPGARIAGPADVPRQARIIAALRRADLPVPAVLADSSEPVVDGRPFYLLEAVDGLRIEQLEPAQRIRDLALQAVGLLRALHLVPPSETGIGDEPAVRPEDEVRRWSWLFERGRSEQTTASPELEGLLLDHLPDARPPALVHGDFHYGNLLFREGRVVAILDWEIAQLGQPLADVGTLALVGRMSGGGQHLPPGGVGIATSIEEVAGAYGLCSTAELTWYLALAYYKYAAIYAYNLMLHLRGKRPDPVYLERIETIPHFISEGIALLGRAQER